MITEIPTKDDFVRQGLIFLNLAWDKVFDILLEFPNIEEWLAFVENEDSENYKHASQRVFSTSIALSQQGAEFLLKANIVGISPYLLISEKPREWPKKCDKQDTAYSLFRTADAQDLIRIHDTIVGDRLNEEFKQFYNDLRAKRNTIYHTVNKKLKIYSNEVLRAILLIAETFIRPKQWTIIRGEYLRSTPTSTEWSPDHAGLRLRNEMLRLIDFLGNSDLKRYFDFDKKKRRYICPICTEECSRVGSELLSNTALLSPNNSSSENLYCFVCDKNINVKRKSCAIMTCKSNVIQADGNHKCLICYEMQKLDE